MKQQDKKVSMHISGYHERELLIAPVLWWRFWGVGLLPVTKQWSAQWGEAPGRSIACWRGAYADSHLSSWEGSIGPIWHLEVDQILIWIQVPGDPKSQEACTVQVQIQEMCTHCWSYVRDETSIKLERPLHLIVVTKELENITHKKNARFIFRGHLKTINSTWDGNNTGKTATSKQTSNELNNGNLLSNS